MTNSIRFYWNGIKVNGEKEMIRVFYSLDNNKDHEPSVSIHARDYDHLPRDLFEVHNETDIYTDYFDNDSAYLTSEHPLYKYARYAAIKAAIRSNKQGIKGYEKNLADPRYRNKEYYRSEIERMKEKIAELEKAEDPGQPTEADLEAIHRANQEAENARIAAQKEAEQKAREETLRQKNEGREFILAIAGHYPIAEGAPVVTINWSEHPAFYSWEDGELKLSVAAAEIILRHFDEEVHADGDRGYDKTSFTINWVDENGEQDSYEGRYDLGDNEGGMIQHIRSFGEFYLKKGNFGNGHPTEDDKELGESIIEFADMLAAHIMTDAELVGAILSFDPDDPDSEDAAAEYIKELGRRNVDNAILVYQQWQNGRVTV